MGSNPKDNARWAARFAAVVLPLAVLAVGAQALFSPPRKGVLGFAQTIDERLKAEPPRVVLVGDSTAKRAVDEALIREQTGLEFFSLAKEATGPEVWYAILEQRVFLPGYRPELIVIAANLDSILRDSRRSGPRVFQDDRGLYDQLQEGHSLIEGKLFDSRRTKIEHRFWSNRVFYQDRMRNGLLYVFGSKPSPVHNRWLDRKLWRRTQAVPDFDWDVFARRQLELETSLDHRLEHTFVVEWIELADKFGARVLFVEVPIAPQYRSQNLAQVPLVTEFIKTVRSSHSGLITLDATVGEQDYGDRWHLTPGGKRLFSERLSEELNEIDDGSLPIMR